MAVSASPRAASGDEKAGISLGLGASPAEVLGAWYAMARGRFSHSFSEWFDPAAVALVEATLGRGSLRSAVETYAAARQRTGFTDDDLLADLTSLVAVLPEGTVGVNETLATRAGLERVLNRVYGTVAADGEPPHRTYSLVVVDVAAGPGARAGRLVAKVADRMRTDLPVDGAVALLSPRRLAVAVDRRHGLARSLASLRLAAHLDPALAEVEVRVTVERLPLEGSGVAGMLDELSGGASGPDRRSWTAPPVKAVAAAVSALLIVAGFATLDMTGGARRHVLQVAGRAGPPVAASPLTGDGGRSQGDPAAGPASPDEGGGDPGASSTGRSAATPSPEVVELVPVVSVRPADGEGGTGSPSASPVPEPSPLPERAGQGEQAPAAAPPPVAPEPAVEEDDAPGRSEDAPGQDKAGGAQSSAGNGKSGSAPGRA